MIQNKANVVKISQIVIILVYGISELAFILINKEKMTNNEFFSNLGYLITIVFLSVILLVYQLVIKSNNLIQYKVFIIISIILEEKYIANNMTEVMTLVLSLILIAHCYKFINSRIQNVNIYKVLLVHISYLELRNIINTNGFNLIHSIELTLTLLLIFCFSIKIKDDPQKVQRHQELNNQYSTHQNYYDSQPQIILTQAQACDKLKKLQANQPSIFMHEKLIEQNVESLIYQQGKRQDESQLSMNRNNSTCKTFSMTENAEAPSIIQVTNPLNNTIPVCNKNMSSFDISSYFSTGLLIIDETKQIKYSNISLKDILSRYFRNKIYKKEIHIEKQNYTYQSEEQSFINCRLKYNVSDKADSKKQRKFSSSPNHQQGCETEYGEDKKSNFNKEYQLSQSQNVQGGAIILQRLNEIEKVKSKASQNLSDKKTMQMNTVSFENANNQEQSLSNSLNSSCLQPNMIDNSEISAEQLNKMTENKQNTEGKLSQYFHQNTILSNQASQCNLSDIANSFFSSQIDDVTVGDLIDYIIYSNPQVIRDVQSQFFLEPYKLTFSPNNQKKEQHQKPYLCEGSKTTKNNEYNYTIVNEFIIISLIRLNSENQKQLIEIKIGCFQFDDYSDNINKMSTSLKQSKESNSLSRKSLNKCNNLSNKLLQRQSYKLSQQSKHKFFGTQLFEMSSEKIMSESIHSKEDKYSPKKEQQQFDPNLNAYHHKQFNEGKRYFFTIEVLPISLNFNLLINKKTRKIRQKILKQVSLDLITPLNSTINMLELINIRDEIPELIKGIYINPAMFQAYVLQSVINDLQDTSHFSKQKNKISLVLQEFSLSNLCLECLNFLKYSAQLKHIELEFYSGDNVPKLIYSDICKVRQILLNLLTNSLKNTQKGYISISLTQTADNMVQVDVKDTGSGISSDTLKSMLQNIKQISSLYVTSKYQPKDQSQDQMMMSQGLNVSYFLSQCLGENRQLQATSEQGKGSVFTFFILNRNLVKKQDGTSKYQKEEFTKTWFDLDNYLSQNKQNNNSQKKELIQENIPQDNLEQENGKCQINNMQMENMETLDIDIKRGGLKNSKQTTKKSNQKIGFSDYYTELISSQKITDQQENEMTLSFLSNATKSISQINDNFASSSFLTINLQRQTLYIYSQILYHSQQEGNSISVKMNNQTSTHKNTNKDSYSLINTYDRYLNKQTNASTDQQFRSLPQTSLQNVGQVDKKIQQPQEILCSVYDYEKVFQSDNVYDENQENDKGNTDFQFKKIQQEIYDDSYFQNTPISCFKDDQSESCVEDSEGYKKSNPRVFSCPKIAIVLERKRNKADRNEQNMMSLVQSKKGYQINQLPQFDKNAQSNNGTINSINNSLNNNNNINTNNNNKVSQIILKTESSLNNSDPNIGEQKTQLLYYNFTSCLKNTNEDLKNSLLKINSERKCLCSQILLIDDNEFNLSTLELRLKQYNFIVQKSTDGNSALEIIKEKCMDNCCKCFSLIFLDIDMPQRNGYEVINDIIDLCSQFQMKVPPISAWTVLNTEEDKQKAFASGMSYYLTKPVNQQVFENILFQEFIIKYNDKNQ